MTSTAVTNVKNYTGNIASGKSTPKNQQDAFIDCFSQAYNGQNSSVNAQDIRQTPGNDKPAAKTDYGSGAKKEVPRPDEGNDTAEEITSSGQVKQPEQADDMSKDIEDAAEEVMEAIASQLGISVEAVREAMLASGMESADMLDPEQVTLLMVELAGDGDSMALLTNEQLYGDVQQVTQKLENVLTELGSELNVSPEELQGMLEDAAQQAVKLQEQAAEAGGTDLTADDALKPAGQENAAKQPAVQSAAPEEKAEMPEGQKEPVIVVENEKPLEAAGKQEANAGNGAGKENSGKEPKDGKTQAGNSYLEALNGQQAGRTDMNAVLQEMADSVERAPDTENIMKQIMDYMKVQVKADMTQMEIQLHPASLGNVNVQISAREGVITAQFTAQNETVKNALEAQIVQLRENLEQQGVKVEAVEVTIASHAFERNLQQDSGRNDGQQQDKKSVRRVNLNMASEEESAAEYMEDADRIAVDMMVRNGNTVDFSA